MNFSEGDIVKVGEYYGTVIDTWEMVDGCYIRFLGEEDVDYVDYNYMKPCSPREFFKAMIVQAIENETAWMYVKVQMPNCIEPELIINPLVNFEPKLEYYLKSYDEEMNHIYSNEIKIIGFGVAESLDNIENSLYAYEDGVESKELDELINWLGEEYEPIGIDLGDTVRIVEIEDTYDDEEKYIGQIGIVDKIYEDYDYPYSIKFEDGKELLFKREEIELV